MKNLKLTETKYNSKELKKLTDDENPLHQVNHTCFLLKRFLNTHSGFERSELQGYLDLFTFLINPPHEPLEKVKILLISALFIPKTLQYR